MIKDQIYALFLLICLFYFLCWVFGDIFFNTLQIKLAQFYLFVEIAYIFYFSYQKQIIQKFLDIPFQSQDRRKKIQKCFLNSLKLFGEILIRGWFFHAPLETIWWGNLEEFYACIWFYKFPTRLLPEQALEIKEFIEEIQKVIGCKFSKGYNVKVKSMRNTIDPVKCDHRLLVVYLAVKLMDFLVRLFLLYIGFSYQQAGMMNYFHKIGSSKKQPIVYVHGIGFGVLFNTKLIMGISEDREIFIVELPWVAQKLGAIIPSQPTKFVQCIEFMLSSHGLSHQGACFVGHSYGCIVITWVLQDRPQLVSSLVLIEPPCLLLYDYKVCYNFLYKNLKKPLEVIARFIAAREISTALSLTRYFWWQENILLFEELSDFSVVILSENDFIVESTKIRQWLASHSESNEYQGNTIAKKENQKKVITVWTDQTIDHGHILLDQKLINTIREKINDADLYLKEKLERLNKDFPRQF